MEQSGGSARGPKRPQSRRAPRRDWRVELQDLAQMVPWPRDGGGPRTIRQVLENVLGYIQYLQYNINIARGGAGDTAEATTETTQGQQLVPYKEEEELEEDNSPWLGHTGPYWEAVDWEGLGGVPLSPPPQREGLLGLSPSLLASPPPPGPPEEVARGPGGGRQHLGAPRGDLGDIAGTTGGGQGRGRGRGQGRGNRRPPRAKKRCVNGFIMFCRLSRGRYLSTRPGVSSTTATRDLAQLWRSLSPEEQRPYCQRARRFSRLHNRVMAPSLDGDEEGDEEGDGDSCDPPASLPLLLATRLPPPP